MITAIVGCLWILGGLFFLYKPDWLKSRLQKKGVKGVRRLIFGLALAAGILLLGAAWEMPGIVGVIIGVLGVISILKAFLLARSKFSETLIKWVEPQPLVFFRVAAVIYIIIGVAFLFGVRWAKNQESTPETGCGRASSPLLVKGCENSRYCDPS
jgi:hypothetical protein